MRLDNYPTYVSLRARVLREMAGIGSNLHPETTQMVVQQIDGFDLTNGKHKPNSEWCDEYIIRYSYQHVLVGLIGELRAQTHIYQHFGSDINHMYNKKDQDVFGIDFKRCITDNKYESYQVKSITGSKLDASKYQMSRNLFAGDADFACLCDIDEGIIFVVESNYSNFNEKKLETVESLTEKSELVFYFSSIQQ